jgi:hypothetical protein
MVKKTAKRKMARKLIKRHNKTLKREPKIQMENSGFIKTISSINNKKNKQEFDWNNSYDGQKASFRAKLNKNGKTETINKTFTNDEIGKLLGYSAVNEPLEMRLKQLSSNILSSNIPVILDDNNTLFIDKPRENIGNMKHFTIQI